MLEQCTIDNNSLNHTGLYKLAEVEKKLGLGIRQLRLARGISKLSGYPDILTAIDTTAESNEDIEALSSNKSLEPYVERFLNQAFFVAYDLTELAELISILQELHAIALIILCATGWYAKLSARDWEKLYTLINLKPEPSKKAAK